MNIISRDEAIVLGVNFYFTGKPCRSGHICERIVVSRNCKMCKSESDKSCVQKRKSKAIADICQLFDGKHLSRKEALSYGLKYYFTRKPCSRGHYAYRCVINSVCVHCSIDYHKETYSGERKKRALSRALLWAGNNKERAAKIKSEWALKNKDKMDISKPLRYAKRNLKRKEQRINGDPEFIARESMSGMVRRISKLTGRKKKFKTCEYLGCKVTDLIARMESLFLDGMSWSNHGKWHIDHIIPVSVMIKSGITDPAIINALSNLQPLWAKDNLSKRNKVDANVKAGKTAPGVYR